MTDLEMTKLCAEAMELTVVRADEFGVFVEDDDLADAANATGCNSCSLPPWRYDPLHNDAQTMALMKRIKLMADWRGDPEGDVWQVEGESSWSMNHDLNGAIVECVARMQTAKVSATA